MVARPRQAFVRLPPAACRLPPAACRRLAFEAANMVRRCRALDCL